MRCLVTGATGFAGRHLVAHLTERGHEVVAAIRPGTNPAGEHESSVAADLLDGAAATAAIAGAGADVVYHLAAPQTNVGRSWSRPLETIDGNVRSTLTVLEAARAQATPPRVLLVSSSEVFGEVDEADLPLAEDAPQRPDSPYSISKSVVERLADFYMRAYGLDVVTVRAFNHIGPGQSPVFVLPSVARQLAALERSGGGELRVGNLEARRDFTDVRDMVRAYAIATESGEPGGVYNAGSGQMASIREMVDALLEDARVPVDVVVDPALSRPVDAPARCSDSTRLRQLGWAPEIPRAQTLGDVLAEARAGA